MRLNHRLTILHMFILVVLLFTLDAESNAELSTVAWTTPVTANTTTQDALWPYLCRVAGVVLFAIIVMTIYVVSESGCKGVHCARKSNTTPDPSPQPLHGGSPTNEHVFCTLPIYENYPNDPVYMNLN